MFLLAFNIIGFAEGYLLRDMGLLWLLPVLLLAAVGAVLANRQWFEASEYVRLAQ